MHETLIAGEAERAMPEMSRKGLHGTDAVDPIMRNIPHQACSSGRNDFKFLLQCAVL